MSEFTKKQQQAIESYLKAHKQIEALGLIAWAENDSLHVIRHKDWLAYEESVDVASASECINYLYFNELPERRIGTVWGVGD